MSKNNLTLIGLVILLQGCSVLCPKPQPGIEVQIQKVEVPVAVPCKAVIPTAPKDNFDKLTTQNDLFTKDQALLADRLLHLGYETELLAALNSCIK